MYTIKIWTCVSCQALFWLLSQREFECVCSCVADASGHNRVRKCNYPLV